MISYLLHTNNQGDILEQNDKQPQEKILSKQRQIKRKRFSKRRNAVSKSETGNKQGRTLSVKRLQK